MNPVPGPTVSAVLLLVVTALSGTLEDRRAAVLPRSIVPAGFVQIAPRVSAEVIAGPIARLDAGPVDPVRAQLYTVRYAICVTPWSNVVENPLHAVRPPATGVPAFAAIPPLGAVMPAIVTAVPLGLIAAMALIFPTRSEMFFETCQRLSATTCLSVAALPIFLVGLWLGGGVRAETQRGMACQLSLPVGLSLIAWALLEQDPGYASISFVLTSGGAMIAAFAVALLEQGGDRRGDMATRTLA